MNVILAWDQHADDNLQEARVEAADALERYVLAQHRIMELVAAIELRRAMGATVRDAADPAMPITLTNVRGVA